MTSYLRPDELKTESEIEKAKKRTNMVKEGLANTASLAAGGLGLAAASAGSKMASKVLPFLNKYIPEELAMKGISKVSPKFGEFLKSGMSQGLTLSSGLEFLKENFMNEEKQNKQNKMSGENILSQYSPDLKSYIENKINEGYSPTKAALSAQGESKLKSAIEKIKKDHKLDKNFGFFDFIESLYGSPKQIPSKNSLSEEIEPQQQMQQGQSQQAPQQGSQGIDPQLAQILQQGSAILQRFRGGNG